MTYKKKSSHFFPTIAIIAVIIFTAVFAMITCQPPISRKYPTPTPEVSPTILPTRTGSPVILRPRRKSDEQHTQ